jgi:hypothetical protein
MSDRRRSEGLTPAERTLRARMAAHYSWAKTPDRTARTAAARQAALDRFEREVDPDGTLDPAERAQRAEQAKRAHMTRMALKSAQARHRKRAS